MNVRAATLQESLALAHGVALRASTEAPVDLLVIKGETFRAQGLRSGTASADIDVLCRPESVRAFIDQAAKFGWRPRETSAAYDASANHARTLFHPNWPCDLDVHWEFPGALADPDTVFEVLWRERREIAIAGTPVPVPCRAASLVLMELHALRSGLSHERYQLDHRTALRLLDDEPQLRDEATEIALRIGAAPVLAAYWDLPIAARPTGTAEVQRLDRWNRRVLGGSTPTAYGLDQLVSLRWGLRWATLGRLIWPSSRDLRLNHPEIPPGLGAELVGRTRRLAVGLRALPAAIHGSLASRRRRQAGD